MNSDNPHHDCWNEADDYDWEHGAVFCPYSPEGFSNFVNIDVKVSTWCPYILEQLMETQNA